jgi:membrane protein DedA with SNARE-associated domain
VWGLDTILEYLQSLPNSIIYIILALSAFVENVFPPIPGDTITAFGAFLVGIKRLNFWGVYAATTVGSLLGFLFLFYLGAIMGRGFFLKKDYRFFSAGDIDKAEQWFAKYGYYLVILNRFLPGIRSVIAVVAGISRLRPIRVSVFALLSCLVWNALWISGGYILGTNWDAMRERLSIIMMRYNTAVFGIGIAVAVALGLRWYLRRRKRRPEG